MTLSDAQISAAATAAGLQFAQVKSVIQVETSGHGFNSDGSIVLRFETAKFLKYTGKTVTGSGQSAYNAAAAIDKNSADLSTSWGLGQIMGFNYKAAGYSSPQAMIADFKKGEAQQLAGMLRFIKANPEMYAALKSNDFATFARLYNGTNYRQNNYDTKLLSYYNTFKSYAAQGVELAKAHKGLLAAAIVLLLAAGILAFLLTKRGTNLTGIKIEA